MKKLLVLFLAFALPVTQNCSAMHNTQEVITVTMPRLIMFVFLNQLDSINTIIRHPDANVNIADRSGKTALWHAANIGNYNALEILLSAHDINKELATANGITPLIAASLNGHYKCVELLIKAGVNKEAFITTGVDQGATALIAAASHGHADCLCLLINAGANKEAMLSSEDRKGTTALICAALDDNIGCLKVLLDAGANKEAALTRDGACGQTALMTAAEKGYAQCVDALINAGANVEAALSSGTYQGKTALIATTMNCHAANDAKAAACLQLLLNAGANKEATFTNPEAQGLTALCFAAGNGLVDCLNLLIEADANLETAPMDKMTPLMAAAATGNIDCAWLLIKAGAKKESEPHTAIKLAQSNQHFLLARFLDETIDHSYALEDTSEVCCICYAEYQEDDLVIQFGCECKKLMIHSLCFSSANGSLQRCPLSRCDLPLLNFEKNNLKVITFPQINGICGKKRKPGDMKDQEPEPESKKEGWLGYFGF